MLCKKFKDKENDSIMHGCDIFKMCARVLRILLLCINASLKALSEAFMHSNIILSTLSLMLNVRSVHYPLIFIIHDFFTQHTLAVS